MRLLLNACCAEWLTFGCQITVLYRDQALGAAGLTKRPTSCMLLLPKPLKGTTADDEDAKEFGEAYESARAKIAAVEPLYMRR